MLKVENLSCRLLAGRIEALRGVNLAVEPGRLLFVAGPSGCGKTTLTRCLCGLIPRVFPGRVSGRIRLGGKELAEMASWEVAQHLAVVFQNPRSQLFTETVEQEVAFGPENLGLPRHQIADRVDWALSVTALGPLRHRRNRTLSLGEKQKVALAGALALRPSVLILDEPLSAIDEASAVAILDTISTLARDEGLAVIILEHRVRYLLGRASRLVVLKAGSVAYDGPPDPLRCDDFRGDFGLRRPDSAGAPAPPSKTPQRRAGALVRARNIAFAYQRGREVFSNLDLDVFSGAGTLVTGPNGSGKTTLMMIFAGLLRPTRGQLHFSADLLSNRSGDFGGRIALVAQEPSYQFRHTRTEEELASWRTAGRRARRSAPPLLEQLDLSHLRHRHPLSLSEGEKRRLAIAAALAAWPRMLVLDEPSVGFDGYHLDQLVEVLSGYVAEGGALLIASNDPDMLDKAAIFPHHMVLDQLA